MKTTKAINYGIEVDYLDDLRIDYTPGMALNNIISDLEHCVAHGHVFSGRHLSILTAMLESAKFIEGESIHVK